MINRYQQKLSAARQKRKLNAKSLSHRPRRFDLISLLTAVSTALLVIVAGLQTLVFRNQLQMMKVDERPWLKVDLSPSSDLVFNDPENGPESAGIMIKITVKNMGKTPAMFVTPESSIHDGWLWKEEIGTAQQELCNKFSKSTVISDVESVTIFPNQEISFVQKLVIKPDEMNDLKKRWKLFAKNFPGVLPVAFGCIAYKTSVDDDWHQTDFAYSTATKETVFIGENNNNIKQDDILMIAFTLPKNAFFAD